MSEQYFLGLEYIFKGSGNPSYPGGQFFNMFNLGKTEVRAGGRAGGSGGACVGGRVLVVVVCVCVCIGGVG